MSKPKPFITCSSSSSPVTVTEKNGGEREIAGGPRSRPRLSTFRAAPPCRAAPSCVGRVQLQRPGDGVEPAAAAFTGARGASSSGSDAARVRYDVGEIEGASCARAACLPVPTSSGSPCCPSGTRAASTAVGAMAAATVLRIGTDSGLLADLVLMMMKTMNKEIKGTSESGALVM